MASQKRASGAAWVMAMASALLYARRSWPLWCADGPERFVRAPPLVERPASGEPGTDDAARADDPRVVPQVRVVEQPQVGDVANVRLGEPLERGLGVADIGREQGEPEPLDGGADHQRERGERAPDRQEGVAA